MKRNGQIIIAAVFVIVIVAMLGMIAASMLSTESFSVAKNLHGIQALNVAEGGMRYVFATALASDTDWSDNSGFGPISLNPGAFTVRYITQAKENCIIESVGIVQGVSRTIRASFLKGGIYPAQFSDYGAYAGNPSSSGSEINFYNQSKIIGNFYFYGNIDIQPPRPPACQTGGAIKSMSIDPLPITGIPDYYESWEAVSTVEVMPFNNSYYTAWLAVANASGTDNLTLKNSDNLNLNGGTVWYNNVTVKDNATITGPGTFCATGVFNGSDNASIIGKVRIIARGSPTSVDFTGSFSWSATAEVIALDKLSLSNNVTTPAESVLYSKGSGSSGIELNLNAKPRGSLLAPYGKVENKGNGHIMGLVYANSYAAYNSSTFEGGAVLSTIADFYNDTMVIQNADVLPANLPEGLTAEAETPGLDIYDWGEVY